jgi:hypothetical protein
MTLAVRDDDEDLLFALAQSSGVGVVRRKEGRGHPQSAWVVYRKDEAAKLAGFLDQHPLRTRKRQDFAVWRDAVRAWTRDEVDRAGRMHELRSAIREARVYRPRNDLSTTHLESPGFDDWLGGFIAGDGSFDIGAGSVRLVIRLRADDAPVLHGIANATGAGRVYGPYASPGSNPVMTWIVCSKRDHVAMVRALEGRIPGRKAAEFAVWRRAVEARADTRMSRVGRREVIDEAQRELRQLRRYRARRTQVPSAKSRRSQQMFEQNLRWLSLLRSWAAAEPAALTTAAYERARRDGWPTRNTLAGRFGSWYDALTAAGLRDRTVMQPDTRDKRLAGGAQAREARRHAQRERVIDAVRRCSATLGRVPAPTEYARWRLHNDPDAPSFVTAYRLFPGGWKQVQSATQVAAGTTNRGVGGGTRSS